MNRVKQYCVCGCSECAVTGQRSRHTLPNDKPAVDSIINYSQGVNADTFNVRIRHTATS